MASAGVMAAIAPAPKPALLDSNTLSACLRMALKLSALKRVSAIADLTFEGNCLRHNPPMNLVQQHPVNWCVHKSLTKSLARALGVVLKTLLIALSK